MIQQKNIRIADYTYMLPNERIAKYPLEQRDNSKLLVYKDKKLSHTVFQQITEILPHDSLLVFNNTKVVRARIQFRKSTGAKIEIFCITPIQPADFALAFAQKSSCTWNCITGNLKKWKSGKLSKQFIYNNQQYELTIAHNGSSGKLQTITFQWDPPALSFAEVLDACGEMPIPPYLNRKAETSDNKNYQTVYSKIKGSVAAPTAGLHFTDEVIAGIKNKGIKTSEITLHVGAGTFVPVKSETIGDHNMHTEHFFVHQKSLTNLLDMQGKTIAVGTTSVRTIESIYWMGVKLIQQKKNPYFISQWDAYNTETKITVTDAIEALLRAMNENKRDTIEAATQIIIVPGYEFKLVNGIVTNFHQPQSTLLLLIAAFVGQNWKKIYDYALSNDFRFLSYGDSSLLMRE